MKKIFVAAILLFTASIHAQTPDTLWTKTYGGIEWDEGCSVQECTSGGFIIAGVTRSFGSGITDVWLIRMEPDTLGIKEQKIRPVTHDNIGASIFSGPLLLPTGNVCKVFDITGRVIAPNKIKPGIYFIEIDGQIQQKVIKVK